MSDEEYDARIQELEDAVAYAVIMLVGFIYKPEAAELKVAKIMELVEGI